MNTEQLTKKDVIDAINENTPKIVHDIVDPILEKINERFDKIDEKFESFTETILNSMDTMFEKYEERANRRFDAMVEQKNDDMRIYNDRYNENKDAGLVLGLRVDELEMRTGRLEAHSAVL